MLKIIKKSKNKLELLAPAGSPEKMRYAFYYGADAVYAGTPDFSLRARINDFTFVSLKKSKQYAQKMGKNFYVTLNIYAHNRHLTQLEKHLKKLREIYPDGIIVSDPGVLDLVKKYLPKTEIHLSTQANATNWRAVKFWRKQGVKRIILAREVSLSEIKEIHQKVPEVDLECFVHGAMCMSYSGRCILSRWMTGRSANLGDCSQPCRWAYWKKTSVIDRKGEFEIDLEEDKHGTYFFNSKDLNLLSHLKDLSAAGVTSFKIEGRNKSVYYLATVVRAYRRVLDNLNDKKILKEEQNNLKSLVHRGYTEGFLFGGEAEHNLENSHEKSEWEFVGEVVKISNKEKKRKIKIKAHNAIYTGDQVEIIDTEKNQSLKILGIYDEKMKSVNSAHGGGNNIYYLETDAKNISPLSLLRKRIKTK